MYIKIPILPASIHTHVNGYQSMFIDINNLYVYSCTLQIKILVILSHIFIGFGRVSSTQMFFGIPILTCMYLPNA